MKTKNKLKTMALLACLSFSVNTFAEEMSLPSINKPNILLEGTQTELTLEQVKELLPWAKDSKIFLADLLDNIQELSNTDKIERLVEGIKQVVGESAPKNSELLMRYTLNRGLIINEILEKEIGADTVGATDVKLRVLISSVKMAINYYETDLLTLTKKTNSPYVIFGIEYFEFLAELNKSVFDASAQYNIMRTSLEWLQWDLYRDLNNTSYANQIVKINNSLKVFPTRKLTDAQSINYVRQIKSLSNQLKIRETATKLNSDLQTRENARIAEENARTVRERNEREKINVGTTVIYPGNFNNNQAKVAAIQDNGQYTIRYENGTIRSNLNRENLAIVSGCGKFLCTGMEAYIKRSSYEYANVTVVGIEYSGNYIVKFNSTSLKGQVGNNWSEGSLAKASGCQEQGYCVGNHVINTEKNATAEILGIQVDGKYLLKFTSGDFKGLTGEDWEKSKLVKDNSK